MEGGWSAGSTSHMVISSVRPPVMNMLSSLEYFLVTMC